MSTMCLYQNFNYKPYNFYAKAPHVALVGSPLYIIGSSGGGGV